MAFVQALVHRLDDSAHVLKDRLREPGIQLSTLGYVWDVPFGLRKTHVRAIESGAIFIRFQDLPDTNSENGPQQDIRVKNQPFARIHLRLAARNCLKSATISSSEMPSASSIFCKREAASLKAACSASLRLRRAGI